MEEKVLSDEELNIALSVANQFETFFPDFPKVDKKQALELIIFVFILKKFINNFEINRTLN